MHILIAPDSFKGALPAPEAARAIENGLKRSSLSFSSQLTPLADGGEGTVDCLVRSAGGRFVTARVQDPLGREITARYGLIEDSPANNISKPSKPNQSTKPTKPGNPNQSSKPPQLNKSTKPVQTNKSSKPRSSSTSQQTQTTAVLEMAAASGLPLLKESEQNPALTTTYGTGQLIKDALDRDADKILLGIGGSATNDAGLGMASALGARFLSASGEELKGIGRNLARVDKIDLTDLDPRLPETEIEVACDVDNLFYGPEGAAHVYAAQKGADSEMIDELDAGLRHLAEIIAAELECDLQQLLGAGAAGGLGGGLHAYLGASLRSGTAMILDFLQLPVKISRADLVITGEGKCDHQSSRGKVIGALAKHCAAADTPLLVLCGSCDRDLTPLYNQGVTSVFSILNRPATLEASISETEELLTLTACNIGQLINHLNKSIQ